MASVIKAHFLAPLLLLVGCGLDAEGGQLFGPAGGAAGAAGAASGGQAGSTPVEDAGGGSAGATVDAAPACPEYMRESGPICVDEKPATLADGSQGSEISWSDALAICATRGLRLCTESERESACPGAGPERDQFCAGPSNTWEWSDGQCAPDHRRSPCCTVSQGFGECTGDATTASFRCCLTK